MSVSSDKSNARVIAPSVPPPESPFPAVTPVISPSIVVPLILKLLPEARFIPESSTSNISVPSTLNVNLP